MFLVEAAKEPRFHALPLILSLAPTLIGTGIKWLQGNSKSKRRSQLATRLSEMCKDYTEQNPGSNEVLLVAHTALGEEITAISEELRSIQADSKRTSHRSISGWLSDTFLLFRPYGGLAWTMHLIFYCGTGLVLLGLLGMLTGIESQETKSALLGFFIFGLALFGVQRIAIGLRRQQQNGGI